MKLLKDKFFEGTETLELNSKVDFDLEIFFDEIRDVVSSIFTEYNSLKEDWDKDIESKIRKYVENIKKKYKENKFIETLKVNASYNWKLELLSDYSDKDFMVAKHWWIFLNFDELENWFIKNYRKFKEQALEKEVDLELKKFYKKFNFKFSNHTKTYLKPIYIKWSFNNEKDNEDLFLNVSIRNKLRELLKDEKSNLKDLNIVIPSKSKIRKNTIWKEFDHAYELILKNDEKIDVVIIDDEILTLSLDENNTASWAYAFLEEMYFNTKEELIDEVKNWVENILMNFSSEESNIINQWNRYQYDNSWKLDFIKTSKTIDDFWEQKFKNKWNYWTRWENKKLIIENKKVLQDDYIFDFNKKELVHILKFLETPIFNMNSNKTLYRIEEKNDIDFLELQYSWKSFVRSGKNFREILEYKIYWEKKLVDSIYFSKKTKVLEYRGDGSLWIDFMKSIISEEDDKIIYKSINQLFTLNLKISEETKTRDKGIKNYLKIIWEY